MIFVQFPDGKKQEFNKGISPLEIAKGISVSLAKKIVAAKYNGELIEITRPLVVDGSLKLLTEDDPESFEVLNHSAAHLMAQAIRKYYPHANFGVGPAIEEGFYYDVDFGDQSFSDSELPKIEAMMKQLAKENYSIVRKEVSYEEAKNIFAYDPYKLELIDEHKADGLTVYEQGDFIDLCRGGHVPSTSYIKHFKLLNLAGAYWRGDAQNKQLVRIYGVAFFKAEQLDAHLNS